MRYHFDITDIIYFSGCLIPVPVKYPSSKLFVFFIFSLLNLHYGPKRPTKEHISSI
jgi:hypothetical protein